MAKMLVFIPRKKKFIKTMGRGTIEKGQSKSDAVYIARERAAISMSDRTLNYKKARVLRRFPKRIR